MILSTFKILQFLSRKVPMYGHIWRILILTQSYIFEVNVSVLNSNFWLMTFGQISKLVLNFKYLLLLSFLTATEFYNLRHIWGIIRCINSKEIIFSDLYYILSDLIFMSAKQTFNTKFVIRRPAEMTWSAHKKKFQKNQYNL